MNKITSNNVSPVQFKVIFDTKITYSMVLSVSSPLFVQLCSISLTRKRDPASNEITFDGDVTFTLQEVQTS